MAVRLPKRARWNYLARTGLPAVFPQEKIFGSEAGSSNCSFAISAKAMF